jgi:multidrug efflux pump subunit AcrB
MFVPASFIPGIAGQFFKQFGITVSVQVISRCWRRAHRQCWRPFPAPSHHRGSRREYSRAYTRLVTWSVRHYLLTVMIGVALFATSIWSIGLLSRLLPALGQLSRVSPSSCRRVRGLPTPKVTEEIVRKVRTRPESSPSSSMADGAPSPGSPPRVGLRNYRRKTNADHQHDLELSIGRELDDMPDMRYWFVDDQGCARFRSTTSADSTEVTSVAEELATQMRRPAGRRRDLETALDRPNCASVRAPRCKRASAFSTEGLSETIRVATIGDVGPALARFDTGDRLVPIRVQLEERARTNLQIIEQLRVPMARGGVPLGTIADISSIRADQHRSLRPQPPGRGGGGSAGKSRSRRDECDRGPAGVKAIKGVSVGKSGDAENMAELSDGFAQAMKFD